MIQKALPGLALPGWGWVGLDWAGIQLSNPELKFAQKAPIAFNPLWHGAEVSSHRVIKN